MPKHYDKKEKGKHLCTTTQSSPKVKSFKDVLNLLLLNTALLSSYTPDYLYLLLLFLLRLALCVYRKLSHNAKIYLKNLFPFLNNMRNKRTNVYTHTKCGGVWLTEAYDCLS